MNYLIYTKSWIYRIKSDNRRTMVCIFFFYASECCWILLRNLVFLLLLLPSTSYRISFLPMSVSCTCPTSTLSLIMCIGSESPLSPPPKVHSHMLFKYSTCQCCMLYKAGGKDFLSLGRAKRSRWVTFHSAPEKNLENNPHAATWIKPWLGHSFCLLSPFCRSENVREVFLGNWTVAHCFTQFLLSCELLLINRLCCQTV